MGRRKIEIKMVKDIGSRQVTFSKRRNGLFKKANELATLCAAQVAIVVFSPGGKPFSFGHPDVDSVAQRFLNQETLKPKLVHVKDPREGTGVQELNRELTDLLKQLQIEKERGKELDKALKVAQAKCKYSKPIDQLDQDELRDMKTHLEQLRQDVNVHVREIEASSSLLLLKEPTSESDN